MNIQVTGKRVEVTDAMRAYIEKKLNKIARLLRNVNDVSVTLRIERYHHIAEIALNADSLTIRGEGNTADMYSSIDMACNRIEKQVRRYRGRIQKRRTASAGDRLTEATMTVFEHQPMAKESDSRVVIKVDKIPVKPMALEEAVMEMDLLDQDFLVFNNAETQEINVIYHRRDGNIGLIEP